MAATTRLACSECDRNDFDFITAAQLRKCRKTWKDIVRVQTYKQSIKIYDDPKKAPVRFNATAWMTHQGVCPECQEGR